MSPQRFALDAQPHQRAEDVPMPDGGVARVPVDAQAADWEGKLPLIAGVKPRHAALRALPAAIKGHFAAGGVGRGAAGVFHGASRKRVYAALPLCAARRASSRRRFSSISMA